MGTIQVQRSLLHRKGRTKDAAKTTLSGLPKLTIEDGGSIPPAISKSATGCRFATAPCSPRHTGSGGKWCSAPNMVRRPSRLRARHTANTGPPPAEHRSTRSGFS